MVLDILLSKQGKHYCGGCVFMNYIPDAVISGISTRAYAIVDIAYQILIFDILGI